MTYNQTIDAMNELLGKGYSVSRAVKVLDKKGGHKKVLNPLRNYDK